MHYSHLLRKTFDKVCPPFVFSLFFERAHLSSAFCSHSGGAHSVSFYVLVFLGKRVMPAPVASINVSNHDVVASSIVFVKLVTKDVEFVLDFGDGMFCECFIRVNVHGCLISSYSFSAGCSELDYFWFFYWVNSVAGLDDPFEWVSVFDAL